MLKFITGYGKTEFDKKLEQYIEERKDRIYQQEEEAHTNHSEFSSGAEAVSTQQGADFHYLLQLRLAERKQRMTGDHDQSRKTEKTCGKQGK